MNDKHALPILKPTDTIEGKRIDQLPVYYIPDRTDGKPSINTPEGWERYRVKSMIQMRLLEEGNSFTEVEKMTGISKSTLTREKRNRKAKELKEQG